MDGNVKRNRHRRSALAGQVSLTRVRKAVSRHENPGTPAGKSSTIGGMTQPRRRSGVWLLALTAVPCLVLFLAFALLTTQPTLHSKARRVKAAMTRAEVVRVLGPPLSAEPAQVEIGGTASLPTITVPAYRLCWREEGAELHILFRPNIPEKSRWPERLTAWTPSSPAGDGDCAAGWKSAWAVRPPRPVPDRRPRPGTRLPGVAPARATPGRSRCRLAGARFP